MPFNIAVVGPGRSRQGTGPYIARAFHQLGCKICAVVSSSLSSAVDSAAHLEQHYGIKCRPFSSIEEVLEAIPIDVVVICSPPTTHYHYLKTAVETGCHVFCEKPFWWPEGGIQTPESLQRISDDTLHLAQQANKNNIILQLNTQWMFTLPGYYALYPQQTRTAGAVETFSMWLSPQSMGKDMIIDAAPHLLSMLYALLGAGRIQDLCHDSPSNNPDQDLQLTFNYLHAGSDCEVRLTLNSTDVLPKPAAYAINRLRVDRHVELPDYLISLRAPDKQLPIVDPLVSSAKNFLGSIHSGCSSDETALIDGMAHLSQIYQAIDSNLIHAKNSL